MERSKKAKRVSWAPDEILCEVKPVLEVECPSRIGTIPSYYGPNPSRFAPSFAIYAKVYGNIWKEKKKIKILKSHDEKHRELPTDYENRYNAEDKLTWTCPPKFDMCHKHKLMAGKESNEVEVKKLREMKELKVFYPHLSTILDNPFISFNIKDEHYDDSQTPSVPIEEEIEEADDESEAPAGEIPGNFSLLAKPVSTSTISDPPTLPQVQLESIDTPVVEAPASGIPIIDQLPAAAYVAALTAILEAQNQGASIDTNCLVRFLSDPQMIERLSEVDGVVVCSSGEAALAHAGTALMVAAKPVTEPKPIGAVPELDNMINNQTGPATNNARFAAASAAMFVANPVTEPVWTVETPSIHIPQIAPMYLVSPLNPIPMSIQPDMPVQPCPFPMFSYPCMTSNRAPAVDATNLVLTLNSMPLPLQPNSVKMSLQSAFGSLPAQPGLFPMSPYAGMTTKDAHYYRNLIKEFGGSKQEMPKFSVLQPDGKCNHNQFHTMMPVQNLKPVEQKNKFQKRCRYYFHSASGCANGSKCLYRHDMYSEAQADGTSKSSRGKKMKLK